jgi:hypothetical protein
MKYVPPYGITTDPDAHYVNGDPSNGLEGSIPPAAAFEEPMREIVAVITKSGITPDDGDLQQMAKGVRSQFMNYAEDTGSVNALSVAYDPPLASYTKGLVLRVRVKNTNTGACVINAGAGNVLIKKMNGADTSPNDLPAGCLAVMVFDGTLFQLVNFIGAAPSGPPQVFSVKIPYCVDTSATPGIITANFTPAIMTLAAGDMLAVKVANTNPGPTIMNINAITPGVNLAPNGGGIMIQGDVHASDVVIFFYDGTNLYFAPNPEISAAITYMCGAGQQFIDVPTALNALRRKTIGAAGHVTLKMVQGKYAGFAVSHPSGDRLTIAGTMIGTAPVNADFAANGNSFNTIAQDAIYNVNMLRSKYGTEIQIPWIYPTGTYGIENTGPGVVSFQDLLVTGTRPWPCPFPGYHQVGVFSTGSLALENVSVWGCELGVYVYGGADGYVDHCFGANNMLANFACNGYLQMTYCYSVGGTTDSVTCSGGNIYFGNSSSYMNGHVGVYCENGQIYCLYSQSLGSAALDGYAALNGLLIVQLAPAFGPTSPPAGTQGNLGGTVIIE